MKKQQGTALLLVLWVTVLLAGLLAGVAAASRSHSRAALYGAERARAQLAAEAGLAHAVAGLRAPGVQQRWVPDGRPYTFAFDGAKVTVAVVDVSGAVDLNAASPTLLRRVFEVAGANAIRSDQLAASVLAWRGGATSTRRATGASRLRQGRPGGPFRAVAQLAQLPGMDIALYRKVEDAFTVYSGRNFPDASYAGPAVLAALRGIGLNEAKILVDARRARAPRGGAGSGRAPGAVANGPLVAGYGGVVQRIFSVATMPDGTRAELDATVRMALTGTAWRPYRVLDWNSR